MSKYIKLEDALKAVRDNTMPLDCWHIDRMRAISSLPTLEVSEDAISREYLKSFEYINKGDFNSIETIREWIDNAPSVLPKPKKGEWILECDAEGEGDNLYRCPRCGQRCGCQEYDLPNYCPNCGAKMKGKEKIKE